MRTACIDTFGIGSRDVKDSREMEKSAETSPAFARRARIQTKYSGIRSFPVKPTFLLKASWKRNLLAHSFSLKSFVLELGTAPQCFIRHVSTGGIIQ